MSAEADALAAGETFRGYVVERRLGKGAIGQVYLVRHALLDTLRAIKVLVPDGTASCADYVKRFLREAKLATRIRHPNLAAVHDCGFDDARGLYYLVMDYAEGGDLRTALAFAGKFAPDKAANVIAQVASALSAARKYHVVHRDLKPENIMLQPDGVAKLIDLGIAKAENLGDSLRTSAQSAFGTPDYVAPEQALNAADVDERADIYSLGVVFYELLSGRRPCSGADAAETLRRVLSPTPLPDVRTVEPGVPEPVARLIARMCAKDRAARVRSYDELLEALADLGARVPAAVHAEYAPAAEDRSAVPSLDDLPPDNPTLSFDTRDAEIRLFVEGLKRKRRRKLCVRVAAAFALLGALAAGTWVALRVAAQDAVG